MQINEIGPFGFCKDTFHKIIFYILPIIFSAGVLFHNISSIDLRVTSNSKEIKNVIDKQNEMYVVQQVQASKIDSIGITQSEMKKDIQDVGDKLDDQKGDLKLIKNKLKVKD